MQAQYFFWLLGSLLVIFVLYRRFSPSRLKNFNFAIKTKSRLLKKLSKQGKKDSDLKHCLCGVEIRRLCEFDESIEDKAIYCLVVVWKRHRDFCVDIPELFFGFRVFEITLGKDHQSEPCPLPATVCVGCGCDNKGSSGNILAEDTSSQEAGSVG
jgi:hypothetical protein